MMKSARRQIRQWKAGWRDTLILLKEFQSPLILFAVAVVGGLRRRGGIVLFATLFVLGDDWLPDLAKALKIGYVQKNSGLFIQAFSGVLAIVTLIFQPDGLGTFTAPVGRWLKGERFSLHGEGGGGAEGVSVRP